MTTAGVQRAVRGEDTIEKITSSRAAVSPASMPAACHAPVGSIGTVRAWLTLSAHPPHTHSNRPAAATAPIVCAIA